MFDLEKLKGDLHHGTQYRATGNQKKKYPFEFARMSSFDDGDYTMRFLPHNDIKCPEGYRIVSMHKIEQQPGEKAMSVLGSESQKEENRSFYIDQLCAAIDAAQLDPESGFSQKMSPALKEAVEKLIPWRRYLFPTIWWAEPYESTEKDYKGDPKIRYRPDPNGTPVGIILEVSAPTGINPKTKEPKVPRLIAGIIRISEMFNDFNQKKNGRNILLTKDGYNYSMQAMDPSPFPKEVENFLGDDYPKIAQFYSKSDHPHEKIVGYIKNSWWAKELESFGISLDDNGPGDPDDGPPF